MATHFHSTLSMRCDPGISDDGAICGLAILKVGPVRENTGLYKRRANEKVMKVFFLPASEIYSRANGVRKILRCFRRDSTTSSVSISTFYFLRVYSDEGVYCYREGVREKITFPFGSIPFWTVSESVEK